MRNEEETIKEKQDPASMHKKRARSPDLAVSKEETPSKLPKLNINLAPGVTRVATRVVKEITKEKDKEKIGNLKDGSEKITADPTCREAEIGGEIEGKNPPKSAGKLKPDSKTSVSDGGDNPLSLRDEMSQAGQGSSHSQKRVKVERLVKEDARDLNPSSTGTRSAEGKPEQHFSSLSHMDTQKEGSCQI